MSRIPFLEPHPPSLAAAVEDLQRIEVSGVYSNFGPTNREFESSAVEAFFQGEGSCLTMCNATIGLMLAIKAAQRNSRSSRPLALMPAYTFAATAQAALWAGVTPLFCDVEPETWLPDPVHEEKLLRSHGSSITAIVPYATFGACLDLERYEWLSKMHSIPVIVDAAASLGSRDGEGRGFGSGFSGTLVFSMHATKTFATGEGGLVYSNDRDLIDCLRAMSNFGFGLPRHATMPGLNGKLSEVAALQALLRLQGFEAIVRRRAALFELYRSLLPGLTFQKPSGSMQAHQFVPALLPDGFAGTPDAIAAGMAEAGVQIATYFNPHLGQQSYFREVCAVPELPVSDRLSARNLSLPLSDVMIESTVERVCSALRNLTQ